VENGKNPPFPLNEMKTSLRRYVKASHGSSLSREILDSEAKKFYRYFVAYAKSCREDGITGFSAILESFYSDILDLDCNGSCRSVKSSLTRRIKSLMRKSYVNDPRYQKTLDRYIFLNR